MENLFYAVPLLGLVGLAVMAVKASWVSKQPAGDEKMQNLGVEDRRRCNGVPESGMESAELFCDNSRASSGPSGLFEPGK